MASARFVTDPSAGRLQDGEHPAREVRHQQLLAVRSKTDFPGQFRGVHGLSGFAGPEVQHAHNALGAATHGGELTVRADVEIHRVAGKRYLSGQSEAVQRHAGQLPGIARQHP